MRHDQSDRTSAAHTKQHKLASSLLNDNPTKSELTPRELEGLGPGDLLGDFEIQQLLGEGGHAQVYLARQRSLGRSVAIKVSFDDTDEAKTLAHLDHPNIVPVYSQQTVDGHTVIAMRYVPGRTLADWTSYRRTQDMRQWQSQQTLDWLRNNHQDVALHEIQGWLRQQNFVPAMCQIVLELARGLQHAHSRGVLHRDIKPPNILLGLDGRAFLMDFHVAARDSGSPAQLLGGTLPYMAPEHLSALDPELPGSAGDVDQRSDLYSLGIVFYEILAGCHPGSFDETSDWPATAIRQLMANRLQKEPQLPNGIPGVTPGLRSILSRCLAPYPQDRYQSVSELIEDLEQYLIHRPLRYADEISKLEQVSKHFRRHRWMLWAVTTVLTPIVLGLSSIYWYDVARFSRVHNIVADAQNALSINKINDDTVDQITFATQLVHRPNFLVPEQFTRSRRSETLSSLNDIISRVSQFQLNTFQKQTELQFVSRLTATRRQDAMYLAPLDVFRVLHDSPWEIQPIFQSLDATEQLNVQEDITQLLILRTIATKDNDMAEDTLGRIASIHRNLPIVTALHKWAQLAPLTAIDVNELAKSGNNEFSHFVVGAIAAWKREYSFALDRLRLSRHQRDASLQPRFWCRFLTAYCCDQIGNDKEAIAEYGVCIGLRPQLLWSLNNLGLIYARQEAYDSAERQFIIAVTQNPDFAGGHANLGVVQFQTGRFEAALTSFSKAVKLGADDAKVLTNRAAAQAALGNFLEAQTDLNRAIALDPDYQQAKEALRRIESLQP